MHMSIIFDIENFFVMCHKDVTFNFLVCVCACVGGVICMHYNYDFLFYFER